MAPSGKSAHSHQAFSAQFCLSIFSKIEGGRLSRLEVQSPMGLYLLLWGEGPGGMFTCRSRMNKVIDGLGISGKGVRELGQERSSFFPGFYEAGRLGQPRVESGDPGIRQ